MLQGRVGQEGQHVIAPYAAARFWCYATGLVFGATRLDSFLMLRGWARFWCYAAARFWCYAARKEPEICQIYICTWALFYS